MSSGQQVRRGHAGSSEEQESKVREFMKKKEQELQSGCQVDKKPEGECGDLAACCVQFHCSFF